MKYAPTSMIMMKIPSVSNWEWHPLSIASSANKGDNEIRVLVKCHGKWTNSLYNLVTTKVDAESSSL